MPLNQYECQSCGHHHEALQKVDAPVLVTCPVCKCDTLKKQLFATGFVLKGGGWYKDNYFKPKSMSLNHHENPC